jgi:uncharacterized protein (TIGR02300 family)
MAIAAAIPVGNRCCGSGPADSRKDDPVAKPEWGTKRQCQSCGAKYYDFAREPIVCPACSAVFDPEAILKARRPRPAPQPKKERVQPAETAQAENEEEVVADEAVEAEEEEEVAEDSNAETTEDADLPEDESADDELAEDEEDDDVMEDTSELGGDDVEDLVEDDEDRKGER